MTEFKKKMMQEALHLAIENVLEKGGPFGAVIVKGDRVIARAANEVLNTNDPTAHAEVQAIRKACLKLGTYELTECEIYCSCEPCPMCLGAIYWSGISKIYYASTREDAEEAGFRDRHIYQEIGLPPADRSIPAERVPSADAGKEFLEWLKWEGRYQY